MLISYSYQKKLFNFGFKVNSVTRVPVTALNQPIQLVTPAISLDGPIMIHF